MYHYRSQISARTTRRVVLVNGKNVQWSCKREIQSTKAYKLMICSQAEVWMSNWMELIIMLFVADFLQQNSVLSQFLVLISEGTYQTSNRNNSFWSCSHIIRALPKMFLFSNAIFDFLSQDLCCFPCLVWLKDNITSSKDLCI